MDMEISLKGSILLGPLLALCLLTECLNAEMKPLFILVSERYNPGDGCADFIGKPEGHQCCQPYKRNVSFGHADIHSINNAKAVRPVGRRLVRVVPPPGQLRFYRTTVMAWALFVVEAAEGTTGVEGALCFRKLSRIAR